MKEGIKYLKKRNTHTCEKCQVLLQVGLDKWVVKLISTLHTGKIVGTGKKWNGENMNPGSK